ncbi:hypothetical protein L226DRAFT_533598 [Lentinus tigrinus ALCF2SS1-7]|uniref:PH domain-containing protein n=1 Tax=Lentinus tigrinus ALCF2SS1-6 TaxID=1328759 RepID=A0A5C2SMC0_9APHY|nr:hypothetical protein L227DRAFT_571862 [Lentinus tigrinus ALCF2SS1-6]RPD76506.1 hypothetical protein L226DRAFT_533598 [Lentinus tigrinus ALCF2SS1-7]
MSAKKLRSKLNPKFFLPLSTSTNRHPTSSARPSGGVLGITADFSDKMFRREPKSAPLPPPPPPPKDMGGERDRSYSFYETHNAQSEWDDVRYAVMSPISESDSVIVISHQVRPPPNYAKLPPIPDEMGVMPAPESPTVPLKVGMAHSRSATSRIPIAASRMTATQRRAATISTPEEAELRRREARRRKEQEEEEAMREEAARQARLKREKEQQLLEAAREEAARKAALEQELRRAAEERRKREAIEREAEALSSMVAAERKRQDRERRRQETAKMQRMRHELEEQQLAQVRERQAWRERVDRERRELVARLQSQKTKNPRGLTVLLTGWVTVQSEDCLSYKRRYFQLREDALLLFKDAEVDSQPLETIQLSSIKRIREWQDGFEELQSIPNSFALEIKDMHDPWSMFTDSSEDKENLLALLSSRLTTR